MTKYSPSKEDRPEKPDKPEKSEQQESNKKELFGPFDHADKNDRNLAWELNGPILSGTFDDADRKFEQKMRELEQKRKQVEKAKKEVDYQEKKNDYLLSNEQYGYEYRYANRLGANATNKLWLESYKKAKPQEYNQSKIKCVDNELSDTHAHLFEFSVNHAAKDFFIGRNAGMTMLKTLGSMGSAGGSVYALESMIKAGGTFEVIVTGGLTTVAEFMAIVGLLVTSAGIAVEVSNIAFDYKEMEQKVSDRCEEKIIPFHKNNF